MIGIRGLQGDYAAHGEVLLRLGVESRVVKKPEQLEGLGGLIMPGGESTTLIKLMDSSGMWQAISDFAASGKAIFGTCAGMILLAKEVKNPDQRSLGLVDISVERNGYGRQIDSAEVEGVFCGDEEERALYMIFIRAPRIVRLGDGVRALAECRGDVVMAQQGQVLVASFHPELTDDLTAHRYFVEMVSTAV
jgi:5'-phosphate synthase pdxT subunit